MDSLLLPNIGQAGGPQILVQRKLVKSQDLLDGRVPFSYLFSMAEESVLIMARRLSGGGAALTALGNCQISAEVFEHDLVSCAVECLRAGARGFTFKVSMFVDRMMRERELVLEWVLTCEVETGFSFELFEE